MEDCTVFYRNENNELSGDKKEILNLWKNYFDQLLNGGNAENEEEEIIEMEEDEENEIPPTLEETKLIIQKKNEKSPGEDGITAEMIKYGGEQLSELIHKLLEKIWSQENIPQKCLKKEIELDVKIIEI